MNEITRKDLMGANTFNESARVDDVINKIVKDVMEKERKHRENLLVDDIVDIYNGKYTKYDDYRKAVIERAKKSDYNSALIIQYRVFQYTKRKGIKK